MSLQNIQVSSSNWLRFYVAIRTLKRGRRQFLLVGIPLLIIVGWVALLSLFLFLHFGRVREFISTGSFFSSLALITSFALPSAIVILLGISFLLHRAEVYIFSLYRPEREHESEVRERIWHRLWGWYGLFSSQSSMVIKDTTIKSSNHWSTWLGGPAVLIIYDGFAAYLERGNSFSRVVGALPIAYLDPRETIKVVVDLRPQIRDGHISAWTKDGIPVTVKMRVEFQIEPGVSQNISGSNLVYPCNSLAVRKAAEYTAVRLRDGKLEEADWCEGTMGKVTGYVGRHVCSHRLDELFMNNGGTGQMLSPHVISGLIEEANASLSANAGVRILSLQITDLDVPPGIRRQRLDVWEAEKDRLVTRIHGETQAYEIRAKEVAQAKAQRDLIITIAKTLARVDPAHLPEPLLFSVSGILDQGLHDPLVQTYMAKGTLDALKKLQDLL